MTRPGATRREFAGRVAVELARTVARRRRTGTVPRGTGDISAAWLSDLIGRRVDTVEVCGVEHGTASRARLALTGDRVPPRVFVKMTPVRPVERLFNNVYALGEAEAFFYRAVASEIPDCAPLAYGTRWDAATGRSIVVLEDLAGRDVRFATAATACSQDEAAVTAHTLARLHRTYWESSRFGSDLFRLSTRASPVQRLGRYTSVLVARVPRRFDMVDDDFRRDAAILHDRRDEIAAAWQAMPQSLLHGDTHRGNLGFRDGGLTLFDWQVTGQGPALKDLAYFASTALMPDVRRSIERDLVRAYVGALGCDITENAAWNQYRMLVVTGYVAAAVTAAFAARLQSDDTTRAALSRAVSAVREHDSFDRLRHHLDRGAGRVRNARFGV